MGRPEVDDRDATRAVPSRPDADYGVADLLLRAMSRGGMDVKGLAFGLLVALTALAAPAGAEDPQPTTAGEAPAGEAEPSMTEINKKLTNPVSDLWSITFQQNNYRLDPGQGHGQRWSSNLLFQPVLPVAISEDWNLITRPVIPLFVSQPHPDPDDPSDIDRKTAFGDITFLNMVSPSPQLAGGWLLGIGPSWILPSAASDWTGRGKSQVGPGASVGYLADKWILAAFVQNWWSFAGSNSRRPLDEPPAGRYLFPPRWLEHRVLGQHPGRLGGECVRHLHRADRRAARQGPEA